MSNTIKLKQDITSSKTKSMYAKKDTKVELLSKRGNVLIVKNGAVIFPINKEEAYEKL